MLHADAEVILPSTLFRFRRKFEITEQVNFFFLQENPSEDLALSPNSTSSMFATSFLFFFQLSLSLSKESICLFQFMLFQFSSCQFMLGSGYLLMDFQLFCFVLFTVCKLCDRKHGENVMHH